MLRPVLVQGPAVRLISEQEAVAFCRADDIDEDRALIVALARAAEQHLDGWSGILGRCLINQVWRIDLARWCGRKIRLPFPDVSAVSIKFHDADDAEHDVDSSDSQRLEDALSSYLSFRESFDYPALRHDREDAVQVTFTAGYGADATAVPDPLRVAARILTVHWYENRVPAGAQLAPVPFSVEALTAPYRRNRL